jgi:hypothetical protein
MGTVNVNDLGGHSPQVWVVRILTNLVFRNFRGPALG